MQESKKLNLPDNIKARLRSAQINIKKKKKQRKTNERQKQSQKQNNQKNKPIKKQRQDDRSQKKTPQKPKITRNSNALNAAGQNERNDQIVAQIMPRMQEPMMNEALENTERQINKGDLQNIQNNIQNSCSKQQSEVKIKQEDPSESPYIECPSYVQRPVTYEQIGVQTDRIDIKKYKTYRCQLI